MNGSSGSGGYYLGGLSAPATGPGTGTGPSPLVDAFGKVIPPTNDPAWQPPVDVTTKGDIRGRARIIHREIPLVTTQTGWTVSNVRQAIENLVTGLFDEPAQLVDALLGDSRVQSAMASRTGGLLGRPLRFKIPPQYKDDPLAEKCLRLWRRHWPTMATEPTLSHLGTWSSMLGVGAGQVTWDTSGKYWLPYLNAWSMRYTYYHWTYRQYIAVTQDGQVPIEPGDGHWVLHAPAGEYRGWMRGAMRAIAPWWLARNYALRDWARYSERHGMPIILADTPFGADTTVIQNYWATLATLGQESVVQLPGSGNPDYGKYDLRYLEASDQAWEGFLQLIDQCNGEITLALLGQNLTSEVKEGSFAAARVHADVRQAILEADARALAQTIYLQLARPFAAINFGNPDLAPRTEWDVAPYEDEAQQAKTFASFAGAVYTLRRSGKKVTNLEELGRDFGLRLGLADIEDTKPLQSGLGGGLGEKKGTKDEDEVQEIQLAPTDVAGIVTVNEARKIFGLPPLDGGNITLTEYRAKHAVAIETVAEAEAATGEPEHEEADESEDEDADSEDEDESDPPDPDEDEQEAEDRKDFDARLRASTKRRGRAA